MSWKRKSYSEAYGKLANKYGSRHKKKYAVGIKAKSGKYNRIGKLSRGKV